MKAKRFLSALMVLLLMVPLLTACLNNTDTAATNEPKVLRILGDEWNVNELGQLFEVANSDNVTIEVIDLNKIRNDLYNEAQKNGGKPVDIYEKMKEILTGPNPPDVVYLDQTNLQQFIDDGLLKPLDSFIEKDKFDIEKIAPAVRDGIRELGNGTLYALSPTFYSSALFYNKDFFTRRNIPFPTDGMTWDEIFNLGRQLKYEEGDQKYYGLAFPWANINTEVQTYVAPLGLTVFDSEFKTVTINTSEWKKAWQTIIDMNNEGVIAPPFDYEAAKNGRISPFADNPFITGNAAMMIGDYYQIRQLSDIFSGNNYYGPDTEMPQKFEWDIVTLPVHEEFPDVGGQVSMGNLMGINSNAENPDLAWKYISFLNGDKVAKVLAKKSYGELVARTEYLQPPEGLNINMAAFTALKPAPYNPDNDLYRKFPNGAPYQVYDIIYQQLDEAAKGNKTVDEALAEAQNKAQEALDNFYEQLEKNGANGAEPPVNKTTEEGSTEVDTGGSTEEKSSDTGTDG